MKVYIGVEVYDGTIYSVEVFSVNEHGITQAGWLLHRGD
jgi:hypothetical protein